MHIDCVTAEMQPWHETPEDVADGMAWAEERARLRAWVRERAAQVLSPSAARCIEATAFECMTHREAGAALGLNGSTVCRNVKRAARRLKQLAEQEGVAYSPRWAS